MLKGGSNSRKSPTKQQLETVVPEPSFAIPATLGAVSALSVYQGWTPAAWLTGILGVFLTIQATRVRWAKGLPSMTISPGTVGIKGNLEVLSAMISPCS